jgi:hypothetical protein
MKLLPVDPYLIPRFRLNIHDINYTLLIQKAFFIEQYHNGELDSYIPNGVITKMMAYDAHKNQGDSPLMRF